MKTLLILTLVASTATGIIVDGEKKLEFVYALWRHGDRSPAMTFPSDPIQESSWTFGEGGFGVLTPIGMEQHFKLGRIMRSLYVETGFLSHQYTSKEVKVFSSKIVRTQVSAVSNMIGMYGSPNGSLGGISYPDTPGWPIGFVPINELVYRSKAFNDLKNNPKTQWVLSELTRLTGIPATLESLEKFYEPLMGESVHFPDQLFSWCSKELFDGVIEVFKVIDDLKAGVGLEESVEGVDLSFEVPFLHGGYFTEMMRDAMRKRTDGVKYFAVSSHDVEVSAFLNVFGIKEKLYRGRPNFTSSIVVELWTDEKREEYVKIFFRNGDTDDLRLVSSLIDGCDGEFCPIDVIDMYITRFRPGNLFELCARPLKIVKTRANRYE
ncbi:hypothetical protein PRIPAC_82818 [Pristionchus pacificus]|uniref:acid phosphatase n=1 Tax=Pristionchus pacificus TaxID=54126 RepID=A0A2A6BE97_PRIPA|nr:hypothetical protein PRIPAC_82818 [Pristionchus pacificus]|eukprot:PDM64202.1 Phosphatase [Pristionchus pacificus]